MINRFPVLFQPVKWEYLWAFSVLYSFLALSACKKNSSFLLQVYIGEYQNEFITIERYKLKGNNPPPSFFSKTLSIIFTIQFFILFSETLIISQTKSWVSQNNRKVKKRV